MKNEYQSFTRFLTIVLVSSTAFGQIRQSQPTSLAKPTTEVEMPKINISKGSFSANIQGKKLQKETVGKKLNLWFDLNENFSFKQVSEDTDDLKITHTNFEQYFKGFLIEGRLLMLHSKNGIVKNINGQVLQFSKIDTEISVSADQAKRIAQNYVNVSSPIKEYPVETVIIESNNDREIAKLAHKVRIDSFTPLIMCYVYIDTQTGEVLNKTNLIAHVDVNGTGQTLYSGNKTITCDNYTTGSYRLRDNARKIETYNAATATGVDQNSKLYPATDYVNTSTTWGGSQGSPELDVHWGMEMTHDFYKNVFNRTGYDGKGATIRQYVDPQKLYVDYFGGINNSMAMPDPYNFIEYGMGDGVTMKALVDLSTIGHEFTHKIIEYNGKGGLNYLGESGALNESFADIMGTCVDFYAGTNPNWIIGEEFMIQEPFMRSMSSPKDAQQPDTYQGDFWVNTSSSADNGGVHTNLGVQNYWFYLLCQGGSGTNDLGNDYAVQGIGIEQARAIVYRNIMTYITKSAKYKDAYYGSLLAAEDLYGDSSPQYNAVMQAWYAVGIGDNPNGFCSGITNLTTLSGTLTDGSSSLNYGNGADCKWVIAPAGATQITLNFTSFDTESGTDIVTVYNGPDENAPVLATLSGSALPATIQTNQGVGVMCVKFVSNSDVTKGGWAANYSSANLGIEDSIMDKSLNIYPNPATNLINVSYDNPSDSIKELVVYDLMGKRVRSIRGIDVKEISVDVAPLEKGMYLLEIISQANSRAVKKLILK